MGPVVTYLRVESDFYSYSSGIYESELCCRAEDEDCRINHAVLVVGYGTDNGTDYWLVKNSWGPYWGDQGFFKIRRGLGECGFGTPGVLLPLCSASDSLTSANAKAITSTNFPEAYNNDEDRDWTVKADYGHIILFSFVNFDIEWGGRDCLYDWVQIVDATGEELLPKSCGPRMPASILSKSNMATVKFHSDRSVARSGFKLEYTFVSMY